MEKYSRFRDSGTGIQVFLTPLSSTTSASSLSSLLFAPSLLFGAARFLLLLILTALWTFLSSTIGASNRATNGVIRSVFGQLALLIMGFSLVKTETVSLRNRGRAAALSTNRANAFEPKKGDIILCNFSSWLDILIASMKFNPIFLLPVVSPSTTSPTSTAASQSKASPARRRNAGASVVTETNAKQAQAQVTLQGEQSKEKRFLGFQEVSLWTALTSAGRTPLIHGSDTTSYRDLATIAKDSPGPVMVFPELVTSNNRGLLRMAPIFPPSWRDIYKVTGALRIGRGQAELYIMSIKHDAPSSISSTSTLSIPSSLLNPIPHIWSLCSSLSFAKGLQIRLLDPNEAPTSANYISDASAPAAAATTTTTGTGTGGEDVLVSAIASLISSLSRLKRTGLGWEDKEVFLELYQGGAGAGAGGRK